jgi:hypothetical protein
MLMSEKPKYNSVVTNSAEREVYLYTLKSVGLSETGKVVISR